jgi:excisionase family DNA binding protein
MTNLVNSSPKSAFEAQRGLDRPLRQMPNRQNSAGTGRKKPVRAESLGRQHPDNRLFASNSGVAGLIAIVEGKRGAWSASELAELLGCSGKHIYALAKSGRIPHLRIGGMIRFDPGITGAWLRERCIAA